MNTIKIRERFVPRDYQLELCNAFDEGIIKRFVAVFPRRSGKDVCAINLILRAAFKRIGTYFYVFPTFSMARRCMWAAIDIQGRSVLDYYIPNELVVSRNQQQMSIKLKGGSQIQFIGSDDVDKTLVGTNALGIVFSEYSMQYEKAWQFSIPILRASDGWALFISTPRGKNHFWNLYNIAMSNDDWFCQKLTVEQTKHISIEEIEKDIADGLMSKELARQEYWCDFDALGVSGSYYGTYIDDLIRKDRITKVEWEPYIPVHTAWDLGFSDPCVIIFFQYYQNQIRLIDFYSNTKQGLNHYAKIIKDKPYTYGKHFAPFDIAVHDLSTGISRWRMMNELGVNFVRYMDGSPSIQDGIEQVRRSLPKMWIDSSKCMPIVHALENYREDKNEKLETFKGRPVHDKFSHIADAIRYLCVGLTKLEGTNDPEQLERRFQEVTHGYDQSNMPYIFRDQQNRQ